MRKVVYKKSDKTLASFGFEDTSRFDPADYGIEPTDLENLPDEMMFCRYDPIEKKIIVDEVFKQEYLDAKADALEARDAGWQDITMNNLAGLTNQQIDNYITNNVTDLASAREALKKLAKWCRALTRILSFRQDD